MKRILMLSLLLLVPGLSVAGCGGDDESRADKVAACLKQEYGENFVSTDKPDLDLVSANSPDGAVAVSLEKQQINIGLHEGVDTANKAIKAYRGSPAPPKKVERDGTAVIAWIVKPTAQQERTVRACIAQS
jgi:hypothetical protein